MAHTRLKSTREIPIDFHPSELDTDNIPAESKKKAIEYLKSNKLSEDDIMIMLEDKVIFGYDYLYNGKKLILPEVNPTVLFYSNAIMSNGVLEHYKEKLLSESSEAGKVGQILSLNHSGTFFQLATNCIINLQASIESFANRIIPENETFIDKDGNTFLPNIDYKLYTAVPEIKEKDFGIAKYKKHTKCIMKLVKLRNDIIHLKPESKTNTAYKAIYRELLNFDYQKTITAVKTYINFYEDNLIEECPCGVDFYYDTLKKN